MGWSPVVTAPRINTRTFRGAPEPGAQLERNSVAEGEPYVPERVAEMSTTPEHLANAARALERILAGRNPQHAWMVEVGKGNRTKPARLFATPLGEAHLSSVGEDPDAVPGRDCPSTSATSLNHNGAEKGA
jgi:hypothetical protein